MRPALPVALALALGAAASCYSEDYLLGAWCSHENECGSDQCCSAHRCRPRSGGDHCREGIDSARPYEWAYMACIRDDDCLAHGMPRCVVWHGAKLGFCADLCFEATPTNCVSHPSSYNRACVESDGSDVCALDCAKSHYCPSEMQCLDGVCVPDDP